MTDVPNRLQTYSKKWQCVPENDYVQSKHVVSNIFTISCTPVPIEVFHITYNYILTTSKVPEPSSTPE